MGTHKPLNRNTGASWYRRGMLHFVQSDYPNAVAAFAQAADMDTRMPNVDFYLGFSLMCIDRYREAIMALEIACMRAPDFVDAYRELGFAYLHTGNLDDAEIALRQALDLDPEDAAAHVHLADLYARQGFLDLAEDEYREAIESEPDYFIAHTNLAVLYRERGKLKPAYQHLSVAIKLERKNPTILENLVVVCGALGWRYRQRKYLVRLFKAAPEHPLFQPITPQRKV